MSTKSSLAHGDSFHLFHELMDSNDDVYLTVRGDIDFEAGPHEVTVRIPIHVWEHVRQYGGFTPHYHLMDDQALLAHVAHEVDERIRAYESANRSGLSAFLGSLVYGSADEPREDQIRQGFEYLAKRRASEREIVERIQALNEAHAKIYDASVPR